MPGGEIDRGKTKTDSNDFRCLLECKCRAYKVSKPFAFARINTDSAFLGTFLGAKAMGRWPMWHRHFSLNSLNLFLLEHPELPPLSEATMYRASLTRHEVSDSITQGAAVKNS